jgi:hypothetical protein
MRNVTTAITVTNKNLRAQPERTSAPKALNRALGQAESPDTTTIGNLPLREYGDPEWINHRL